MKGQVVIIEYGYIYLKRNKYHFYDSEKRSFSIMSPLVCTLIYINKVININIINELLRYFFTNSLLTIWI